MVVVAESDSSRAKRWFSQERGVVWDESLHMQAEQLW